MAKSSIRIQDNVLVTRNEKILSIGFFEPKDFKRLYHMDTEVCICYEASKWAYDRQVNALPPNSKNFFLWNVAVSNYEGQGILSGQKSAGSIEAIGSSKKEVIVPVVKATDVLEKAVDTYGLFDKLLLNCEGSEIEIINSVDLSLFEKFSYIFVQFHDFTSKYNLSPVVSPSARNAAMKKLKTSFSVTCYSRRYSKYGFTKLK